MFPFRPGAKAVYLRKLIIACRFLYVQFRDILTVQQKKGNIGQLEVLTGTLRKGGNVYHGEMPECDRLEITNVFNAMGLDIQMSVSKRLSFPLTAEEAKQIKIDRANALGIPIFSTEDFGNAVSLVYPPTERYR